MKIKIELNEDEINNAISDYLSKTIKDLDSVEVVEATDDGGNEPFRMVLLVEITPT